MSESNLKTVYLKKIRPELARKWGLKNLMAVPRVEKVVVNRGIGEGASDKKVVQQAGRVLAQITGQKPKVALSRVAVAGFRLRQGAPIGLVTTLRGEKMYAFLEKLFKIVLPRLRDFQGLPLEGFDGRGNYSLGISEDSVFPEFEAAGIEKTRGLQVTLVTNTNNDKKAKELLALLGMPFRKKEKKEKKNGDQK